MSFLSMRGRGPDGRLDNVIEKIASVHSSATEHIESLSSVDIMQQEAIDQLQRDLMQAEEAVDFVNNRTTDVTRRVSTAEDAIKVLLSRPTPIIPDIRPIRAEISRVQTSQDEWILVHHGEMHALWAAYRDLKSDLLDLSSEMHALPKPLKIWPAYCLILVSIVLGLISYAR